MTTTTVYVRVKPDGFSDEDFVCGYLFTKTAWKTVTVDAATLLRLQTDGTLEVSLTAPSGGIGDGGEILRYKMAPWVLVDSITNRVKALMYGVRDMLADLGVFFLKTDHVTGKVGIWASGKDVSTHQSLVAFGELEGSLDDTAIFTAMFACANAVGGNFVVPNIGRPYIVKKNLFITRDGVRINFCGSQVVVSASSDLNMADDHAAITILANGVTIENISMTAGIGVNVTGLRCGDYTYDSAGNGTMYERVSARNIYTYGMGKSGVGCGAVVFAALKDSHAEKVKNVSAKGQSFAMYGSINCSLDNGCDENNGETAFYIGPNRGTSVPSQNCWLRNIYASNDAPSGTFVKVSRGSINCGVDGAKFVAYGNGTTFRAIDAANGQEPPVWMQSGYKTSFRNVHVELHDLDQQTTAPFGLFAHDGIAPIDGGLYYPEVSSSSVTLYGTTAGVNGCLIYPVAGLSVLNPVFDKCVWSSQGNNTIVDGIQAFANDSSHGKVTDVVINSNRFHNCNRGFISELGPKGNTGDIGNVYITDTNTVSGTTPAVWYVINSGALITSRNAYKPAYVGLSPVNPLPLQPYVPKQTVRILNNTGPAVNIDSFSGVSTDEGVEVQLIASWNSATGSAVTLKNAGAGSFRLQGGIDAVLTNYMSIRLVKSGADWVEVSRRTP